MKRYGKEIEYLYSKYPAELFKHTLFYLVLTLTLQDRIIAPSITHEKNKRASREVK